MFKINFQLQELDKIIPFGKERDCLSWFVLTDSLLWITAGEGTIYEYSKAALEYSKAALEQWKEYENNPKYNDYQLSRFLEDFSYTFSYVRESIPRYLYDIAGDFRRLTDSWKESHFDDDDEAFDKFYDNEYTSLTEWFYERIFDSGHLIGGPLIGCFRCGDMVKIYWESDYLLEGGESIWAYPKGVYELPYSEFIAEVKGFFHRFYSEMDRQVELALEKDWGSVELDKKRLSEENAERKIGFNKQIDFLSKDCEQTDWEKVRAAYEKMEKEMKERSK